MRKHQIENAAFEVATQVRAVEDSIDAAIAEVVVFLVWLLWFYAVAATGFGTIHPALQKVAAAVSGLVDTRGAIVECHAALAEAKTKVPGLCLVAIGDEESPKTAQANLRIVA